MMMSLCQIEFELVGLRHLEFHDRNSDIRNMANILDAKATFTLIQIHLKMPFLFQITLSTLVFSSLF